MSAKTQAPVSFAQRRLWFLDQVEPGSTMYNMPSIVRLAGHLRVDLLQSALDQIIARHESLRTRFASHEGEPVQVIDEEVKADLLIHDLTALPERDLALQQLISKTCTRPFNLTTDRLASFALVKLQETEHVFIVVMHHIITDEWSFQIFFRELSNLYESLLNSQPASLPELPIQYRDYALWQREWLDGDNLQEHLAFWKAHLTGNPSGFELPTDYPRRANLNPPGAARWQSLGEDLSRELKSMAKREGTTLYIFLLAAFKLLLYRYTRQPDIIVGSPVAGRSRMEIEDLIGFFVNTLPLRSQLSGKMTFHDLLGQTRELVLEAFSHQEVPFEKMVEALQPERTLHATPFVNVLFFIHHDGGGSMQWPGLDLEWLGSETGPAKFDLTLTMYDRPNGLVAVAQYNRELFEEETMARFLEHYATLIREIVAGPARLISELPLMDDTERTKLLVEWNDTQTTYPQDRSVHALFEEQARKTPSAIAVQFGNERLTFKALNDWANQLARLLVKAGAKPGIPIAFGAERSLEMVIGILAILKSGAAYAPLDPALPPQRLARLVETLAPPVLLLTHERFLAAFPEHRNMRTICMDADRDEIARESAADLSVHPPADNAAYISFTSGSTGVPKGVCIPHRAIVRLVRGTNYIDFGPDQTFLQFAPLSFDASTFEIWGALLNGGRLVVFPPNLPSLSEMAEAMQRHGVTTAWFTSGLFNQIVDEHPECLRNLRQVITGGDVLSPPHVHKALKFLNSGILLNGYGPTENGTFTTCYRIPANFDGKSPLPIGRPIANTRCYVLDEHRQLVPIGVPGELYVGGDGLATAYLNDPELTAEKFVPDPFHPGERLYRTGDRVRHLPDGNLQFLGRMTAQVKVRGFRVELGEIESVLLQHPGVEQCAVIARRDPSGNNRLIAFFVPRENPELAPEALQEFLRQSLPDYMVPAVCVPLQQLPLSSTGKLDRNAFPNVEITSLRAAVGPRNETEQRLQQIWEEILETRPIGVHDNFFTLGGHSLLAMRLLARIEKTLGTKLKVSDVFQNPTIAELGAILRGKAPSDSGSSIVAIQPNGSRPPLWFVHGAGGGMFWGYSNLARHLGPNQPVFAFNSRGLKGEEELDTIEKLAEAYLHELRRAQPHGPYNLGGYCFGGLVAYEMACRLHQQGETISNLMLINSTAPNSSYSRFGWTPYMTVRFAANILVRIYYTGRTHPEKIVPFVFWKLRSLLSRCMPRAAKNASYEDWVDLSQYDQAQRLVWCKHLQAIPNYFPKPYPGDVLLFRTPAHVLRCSFAADYGWKELVRGELKQIVISGAHETIMEEPKVRDLAAALGKFLTPSVRNN